MWIRSAGYDELKSRFEEIGIFNIEEFYYISAVEGQEQYVSIFEKLMQDNGYKIITLWKDKSELLYLKK